MLSCTMEDGTFSKSKHLWNIEDGMINLLQTLWDPFMPARGITKHCVNVHKTIWEVTVVHAAVHAVDWRLTGRSFMRSTKRHWCGSQIGVRWRQTPTGRLALPALYAKELCAMWVPTDFVLASVYLWRCSPIYPDRTCTDSVRLRVNDIRRCALLKPSPSLNQRLKRLLPRSH